MFQLRIFIAYQKKYTRSAFYVILIELTHILIKFIIIVKAESEESENEKTPSYHIDERPPSFDVAMVRNQ